MSGIKKLKPGEGGVDRENAQLVSGSKASSATCRLAQPDHQPDATVTKAFCERWFEKCDPLIDAIEIGWQEAAGMVFQQFEMNDLPSLAATVVKGNLAPGQSVFIRLSSVDLSSNSEIIRHQRYGEACFRARDIVDFGFRRLLASPAIGAARRETSKDA